MAILVGDTKRVALFAIIKYIKSERVNLPPPAKKEKTRKRSKEGNKPRLKKQKRASHPKRRVEIIPEDKRTNPGIVDR